MNPLPYLAAIAAGSILLAGCQTAQIQQTVSQLSAECQQLQLGLAAVDVFVDSVTLTSARAILYGVCSGPATNNPSAIAAVRKARTQVQAVAQKGY